MIHDPEAVKLCLSSVAKIVGEDNIKLDTLPHLGGEDFSEYTSRVPGAICMQGSEMKEEGKRSGFTAAAFI